jgi:hypothetical protein
MQVDPITSITAPSPDNLDPAVFTDPHFVASLMTFQDHLYSGWMTAKHKAKLADYERGIRDGTLHAPYKDEVWDAEHRQGVDDDEGSDGQARVRKSK